MTDDIINASTVLTSMINRYFSPAIYNAAGFQPWIAVTESEYNLLSTYTSRSVLYVIQYTINYYDFPWIDTSELSLFQAGIKLFNYKTNDMQTQNLNNVGNKGNSFELVLVQARS